MSRLHQRDWPIYLILVGVGATLFYLGRKYIMQIYYNDFLLGLGALALGLVLTAWAVGGAPDAMNDDCEG